MKLNPIGMLSKTSPALKGIAQEGIEIYNERDEIRAELNRNASYAKSHPQFVVDDMQAQISTLTDKLKGISAQIKDIALQPVELPKLDRTIGSKLGYEFLLSELIVAPTKFKAESFLQPTQTGAKYRAGALIQSHIDGDLTLSESSLALSYKAVTGDAMPMPNPADVRLYGALNE